MNVAQKPLILQLDVAGNPSRWITYEEAAYYSAKNLIAWTPSDDSYTIRGGINRITASQSKMVLNTIIAIKGEMGNKHLSRVPTLTNKALFRRDHNVCAYCGHEFVTAKLTRDHVMPSSRGGKNIWTNVVTSCGPCNKRKDDHTIEQSGMKLLYVPYVPSRHEYLILMNRTILADQMSFLMAKVPSHSRLHTQSIKTH